MFQYRTDEAAHFGVVHQLLCCGHNAFMLRLVFNIVGYAVSRVGAAVAQVGSNEIQFVVVHDKGIKASPCLPEGEKVVRK